MLSISPNRVERAPRLVDSGSIVHLVQTDSRVREVLTDFLMSRAFNVLSFKSAREYLAYPRSDAIACLVIDLHLSDVNGLDLQQQLSQERHPPIIFISDRGDTQCTVRAMKAGAIEFLTYPVDSNALLAAIDLAFAQAAEKRERKAHLLKLRERFALLSPREQEVFPKIVSGLRNKQVAWELGISAVTVQVHRGQIMRKMAATSFAELVRMDGQLHPWLIG